MSFLDAMVSRCFRDSEAGRVIIFPLDRRKRAYLVRSESEEQKIRPFLKVFFSAHLSILLLTYLLAYESSMQLVYALGRPAAHLLRTSCIFVAIWALVSLPYLVFWRTYKNAFISLVSAQDEVQVSARSPLGRLTPLGFAATVCIILIILAAIGFFVGSR
jgi:hypothetical protein